ncbi:MAG: GMC family oxidoreductase, partial [Cytophagales bacterium]|nr:GMC family oxidoreductase [Cytophagales bacterium]
MNKKIYDYIVIGSGFGGSVSAMRLAEKGYSVLILEKGKAYQAKDFPKTNWNFPKFFWAPLIKWFGFQKLSFFKEVFILSGVGVGGGSLVYANTHMFPPDEFFSNTAWSYFKDWKKVLEPFYEKARFMLGTTKNKSFDREDEVLQEVARDMGRESSFEGVNVGVYFGDTEKEVDPYFKGLGPKRKGCIECAGCMVGCRHNAKNTLDKNYLFFAKKFGSEIEAERMVEQIEFREDHYHIHTHSSTSWFKRNKETFISKGLVVSGGVLGTMNILLKQKHKNKTLTALSDKLGENLRTNSESLCGVTAPKEKLNHGLAITSIFNPDEKTHIEVVKYPDGSDAMRLFSTLATGPGHPVIRIIKLFFNILKNPFKFLKIMVGKNWAKKSVIFLVMQSVENSMKMVYKRFPFFRISIWNKKENRVLPYIDIGQKVMLDYAKKINGIPQNTITEVLFNMSTTAHIIGGCPMGKNKAEGVVNDKFEVHGYPRMYILDGSIIPCNLGVNPSLTI